MTALAPHYPVVIVGGGQAGLATSYHLKARDIAHIVLERHRIAHSWRNERWDSFCLVTPNWQCQLPGHPYRGGEPHGFMPKDDIVAYVEDYARSCDLPVAEGIGVERLERDGAAFRLQTSGGAITADAVVLAVGGYHRPNIPRGAEALPAGIAQLHSSQYRNPAQLPDGEVLVVGSGQSGCQIAEDLHLSGQRVHLVVGSAPRCPRFYRGRDAVDWLADLGQYDLPVHQHPLKEGVRKKANHYLTGRGGGRDIDLRKFAGEGMRLYGRLRRISEGVIGFEDDLEKNLDAADAVYNGICALIDKHIDEAGISAPPGGRYEPVWRPGDPANPAAEAPPRRLWQRAFSPAIPDKAHLQLDPVAAGITSVVWSTGFRSDYGWVRLPMFDGSGYPIHQRGVTAIDGVYVVGLPWLHSWGSGRFIGVGRDADFIVRAIAERQKAAVLPGYYHVPAIEGEVAYHPFASHSFS
ncbi:MULTISPECIES: MSMEG_0569 family flavin-dependent oxidoreductase [Rhodomicrobium]|uniref:MSMEG_0569 family flavin-dependent oxidoreductase n=1 Tax=Rhodomicrobium TaxID=1068 RepID=UPI000B4BF0FC|nr:MULTISPECIES: MSMEG_0569 family flavin-dependent oxidoreductase [Rhodomicrobium]